MVSKIIFILKQYLEGRFSSLLWHTRKSIVFSCWNLNSFSIRRERCETRILGRRVPGPKPCGKGKVHTEFHPINVTFQTPCSVQLLSLADGRFFWWGLKNHVIKGGLFSGKSCGAGKKVSCSASCCCIFFPKLQYSVVRGTSHVPGTTNGK